MTQDRAGWICPACKRGVSPDEKTCNHGGMVSLPNGSPGIPVSIPTPFFPPETSLDQWQTTLPVCDAKEHGQ